MKKNLPAIALPLPLLIFLLARVPILLALPFDGLRGYGDLLHFFNLAMIPGLPFINYWIEFPPGFAYLNELLYAVSGGVEHTYTYLLILLLTTADIGNVLLFQRLEKILFPGDNFPSWRSLMYAALIAGLPYTWWYFDSLAVFFAMLALYLAFTNRKAAIAGFTLAIGMLIKLFPLLVLPALVRSQPLRRSALISISAVAVFCLPMIVTYSISPSFTRASLASRSSLGSVATVWALIDGNYRAGGYGPLVERLDPQAAYQSSRNPQVISSNVLLGLFGLVGIVLFFRACLDSHLKVMSFYGLTLVIFFMWSSAWSPQWVIHLIPVALLVLPASPGVLLVAVMVMVNLLEWPLLLSRGLFYSLPLTVTLRGLLMVLLGFLFYRQTQGPGINHRP